MPQRTPKLIEMLRSAYDRDPPADETLWHKWFVFWPRRATDGRVVSAAVWRRRVGLRWEYQPRDAASPDMHIW